MRGEHGPHIELDDRVEHFICRMARLTKATHGPASGGGLRRSTRIPRIPAASPYPMHLLGRIDEQEEQRECSRGNGRCLQRKCADAIEQLVERWRIGISTTSRARRASQSLPLLVLFIALEPLDHAAECGGETTDIFVEWLVLGTS